jgi:hypothetical protein
MIPFRRSGELPLHHFSQSEEVKKLRMVHEIHSKNYAKESPMVMPKSFKLPARQNYEKSRLALLNEIK